MTGWEFANSAVYFSKFYYLFLGLQQDLILMDIINKIKLYGMLIKQLILILNFSNF